MWFVSEHKKPCARSLFVHDAFPNGRIWFVSRHEGAIEWAKHFDLPVDVWAKHLSVADISAGDVVLGTLPVDLIAQLSAQSTRVYFLVMPLRLNQRGHELSLEEMLQMQCYLQEYVVSFGEKIILGV